MPSIHHVVRNVAWPVVWHVARHATLHSAVHCTVHPTPCVFRVCAHLLPTLQAHTLNLSCLASPSEVKATASPRTTGTGSNKMEDSHAGGRATCSSCADTGRSGGRCPTPNAGSIALDELDEEQPPPQAPCCVSRSAPPLQVVPLRNVCARGLSRAG